MRRVLSLCLLTGLPACSGDKSGDEGASATDTDGTGGASGSATTTASTGQTAASDTQASTSTSATSVGTSGATGTGGITTAGTSLETTGGADPCAVQPEATCALTPGCMAVQGQPFVPNGDAMGYCRGPAEFIGCMAESACPPVVLTLCPSVGIDDTAYEVASGCQPSMFEPCDPPDMVSGDCP